MFTVETGNRFLTKEQKPAGYGLPPNGVLLPDPTQSQKVTLIPSGSFPSALRGLHLSQVPQWQDHHYVNVCANALVWSHQVSSEADHPRHCHFAAMGLWIRTLWHLFFPMQLLTGLAEPAENLDFFLPGDYLLGGLFTLHANAKGTSHLTILQVPSCEE